MALSWLEMAYREPGSTGAAWCYLLPMYGAQVCSLRPEGRAHSNLYNGTALPASPFSSEELLPAAN